jgi:hypothetical protein
MEGMKRPEATVLPDTALIPPSSVISPPPNQFTHEVTRQQPFYFSHGEPIGTANGEFRAGTKVVLLVYDGGTMCRVADGAGLYADTSFEGLQRL